MGNLYNANNNGIDGVSSQVVAGDKCVVVGADQNSYPSVTINSTGMQTTKTVMTASAGAVQFDSAMTKCEEIDTSHLFQTGNYKVFAGNNFTVSCGSGGITFDTTGNIKLNSGGGMTSISSPMTLDISSQTVQMTAHEGMRMSGENMEMDVKNTNFGGNVDFGKNLKLSGSLAVQGELYSTHLTAQKQIMLSDESGAPTGYINPLQSFALTNGSSNYAKAQLSTGGMLGHAGLPPVDSLGMVDVLLDMGNITTDAAWTTALSAAGPAAAALEMLAKAIFRTSLPIKIKIGFPKGVHLISNTAMTQAPESTAMDAVESSPAGGLLGVASMSDIIGPSHQHQYYIPASTLVDSTDQVWKAAQACNADEAAEAQSMQPFGMSPGEFMQKSAEMAAKHAWENSSACKTMKDTFGFSF